MRNPLRFLDHWPSLAVLALSFGMAVCVAVIDSFLGPWIHTGVLYTGPVAICAWYCGRTQGVALAVAAVFIWLATDTWWSAMQYSPYVHLWNSFVRLFLLLLTAELVTIVRLQFRLLSKYAEQDSLTGLCNRRAFTAKLSKEHDRLSRYRHPLSLAYIDLDNFKSVNDTRGHAEGDRLLRKVAEVMLHRRRNTDVAARLGGDEFGLLLVETDEAAAISAIRSLRQRLLAAMKLEGWPVTFSIGVVTFYSPVASAGEALIHADRLMYVVKHRHKDGILYQRWEHGELMPSKVIGEK